MASSAVRAAIVLLLLSCCILDTEGSSRWWSRHQLNTPRSSPIAHGIAARAARALLSPSPRVSRTDEEPFGAVGAPDKWMYRLLSGTWLEFKSEAGDPDDSRELCAKARMATACANRAPESGLRKWPKDRRRRQFY